jgi:N-methylhydantoinase B
MKPKPELKPRRIDGVRLAVLASRLDGVVREMLNALFRSGRSTVLNTGRDFSCCILSADDELVSAAESIPVHVMRGPDIMAGWMRSFHPDLRRGDAFLHNSPYHGNSHAADHSILVPVIDEDGHHRFTVLAKAHVADCGNSVPTTYWEAARDVYEEGALIFPCVQVQRDYNDIDDIVRMCEMRIRVPRQWKGDHLALVGAARVGEQRLLELGSDVGWDVLQEHVEQWFDYSERMMIQALSGLQTGHTERVSFHDPFPGLPESGMPVKVMLHVDSEDASVSVDLRDNVDCLPCGLNLTEATAQTAALIGVFNSVGARVPPNGGSFRRITVLLRENCAVGIPRHPVSCSLATTHLTHMVQNAVQRCFADISDGMGMADFGLVVPPSAGVISGRDPRRNGEPFVGQLILPALTGGAASHAADGWLMAATPGNAGVARRDSTEIDELRYPIRIWEQRLVPNSEGAGRFRGAPSAYCEYGPVDTSMTVMYASNGTVNSAQGAAGGEAGGRASQAKRLVSGEIVALPPYGAAELADGERIISICSAGGGYGAPRERDKGAVAVDVSEGWITAERALEVYGVAASNGEGPNVAAAAAQRSSVIPSSERTGTLPLSTSASDASSNATSS